jgi:phenylalanyl-tRNA synthetase beta chain
MKISPQWLREFVDLKVDDRQLAEDLTMAGASVETMSGEGENFVLDFEITTNRPDQMNHYGIARECSAIYDVDLKPLQPNIAAPADKQPAFKIEIEDPQACARYTAQIVRGVTIGPSPTQIARRLELVDARPINNGVDASNYTLIEMGHPTHAFDLDLLEGNKIMVRRARTGESLKTLDGVDRKLDPNDLVIADAVKPVALAGVMGGFDTMITDRTKNILIESAWFDPVSVRQTARRHGMHTDASHRFERGADWGATPVACARVAELILATGGKLDGGQIDVIGRSLERQPIRLSRAEVHRILGQDIPEQEIARILRRLGFKVTAGRASSIAVPAGRPVGAGGTSAAIAEEVADFTVTIPTWRLDVEREIDLIEEIARIYGYNRFANTLPAFSGAVVETAEARKDAALRSDLLGLGYNEAVSLTFISHEDARAFSTANAIEIANPLSEEASVMRTSMLPGMLRMLEYNLNRGARHVRLFEAGRVYELVGGGAEERKQIAIGATGFAVPPSVHSGAREYSFFDLKGDVETLLSRFEHRSLHFDANTAEYFHPGRSGRALMDGATVAQFGQLHPDLSAKRKLKQEVFVAELFLDRLYRHELRRLQYRPLSRFPAVDRDFSFIFDDSVSFERIRAAVNALRIPELQSFEPVEIFHGGVTPSGKYSVLLRAEFQSSERTLRDDEVALWAEQIIQALRALGGMLRAS